MHNLISLPPVRSKKLLAESCQLFRTHAMHPIFSEVWTEILITTREGAHSMSYM